MASIMALPAALLLLLLPLPTALLLPRLLLGSPLEEDVLGGLAPVTTATVAIALACNAHRARSSGVSGLARGFLALVGGALACHLVLVLFGAPIAQLVPHTHFLALMLAALAAVPMGMRYGARMDDWVRVLLHLRVRDADECWLAGCAIGSAVGAYMGALPIPLDWDRPWQQWPLTCVYGALAGHAVGGGVGLLLGRSPRRFVSDKSD